MAVRMHSHGQFKKCSREFLALLCENQKLPDGYPSRDFNSTMLPMVSLKQSFTTTIGKEAAVGDNQCSSGCWER